VTLNGSVREIFDSALELDGETRAEFIDSACNGDDELQREVETLLSSDESVDEFMETPAVGHVADIIAADHSPVSSGQMLGRYEILRKVGEGGMGEVYLARDNDLDREVAIKLLHEKNRKSESDVRRFTQEAKAASALNHPNILTIYEIGRADGSHYIVSEYIKGQTLRNVLKTETLNLSKILDVSVQVAAALATAHSAYIIHRDIKPENVIVRDDGYVKVLDFGLAKLLSGQNAFIGSEDVTAVKEHLTAKGMILGTISYMSPEQARGDAPDTRTDIFSLGVMIYEMVAGRTPFEGNTLPEMFANLLSREPEPLSGVAAGVPIELERIVMRALRKDPGERYQTMRELLSDLTELKEQISTGRRFELTYSADPNFTTQKLRHTNDGLDEESKKRTPFQHIRLIVSSSWIYVAGLMLVVLIGALYIVYWSDNRNVQSEKAQNQGDAKYSRSPGFDHYMRGRVNAGSENRENNEKAIAELEQAVALDPELAPAYAELARAYNVKSFYLALPSESDTFNENAMVAVEKSLALNPNLPEGYFARGLVLWSHKNRFPHEQTIQSYKRALALNPNLDEAHHQLGLVYFHIGLFDKAWDELQSAVAINPGNTLARYRLGVVDMYRGKYEEALLIFDSTPLEKNPSLLAFQTANAQFNLGRITEAEALIDKFLKEYPDDAGGVGNSVKAMILAKNGKEHEAENAIQRAIEVGNGFGHFHHTAFNIAVAYALMGKPDKSVQWLKTAADDGLPCYPLFDTDPSLNSIRTDEQFIAFMAKLKQQWERFQAEF
jgi:Serine/threonine protein kinase